MPESDSLAEATIAAAWNVQGDPRTLPLALPVVPNTVARIPGGAAFWLGPRSWLVLADGSSIDAFREAGCAVFDVSASRVAWTLRGPRAGTVLNKHCPLDLHPSQFPAGACAQSLFGQVNALYYRHASADAFTVFVARSFGHDVLQHLQASYAQYGCAAAAARPFVAD